MPFNEGDRVIITAEGSLKNRVGSVITTENNIVYIQLDNANVVGIAVSDVDSESEGPSPSFSESKSK